MKFILASKSPRRIELLRELSLEPQIIPADINEDDICEDLPEKTVCALSKRKAQAVAKNYPDALVVAADTLVFKDNALLGKPKDENDARKMLKNLSGTSHSVFTGFCVAYKGKYALSHTETKVNFRTLSEGEIDDYIATGEPFDKAGAYGIQGRGKLFVESISGDYFNIVGLPVCALFELIKKEFGITPEQLKN